MSITSEMAFLIDVWYRPVFISLKSEDSEYLLGAGTGIGFLEMYNKYDSDASYYYEHIE